MLIDGNSVAYRAFYALPPLTNKKGEHTNAIFGFVNMLVKLVEDEKPTHLAVVFDFPLKENFRTKLYAEYKATRKPMPDELRVQMPVLKELLRKMGISVFEEKGFEADDIIGTLAKRFCCETLIVTGDRDCLQLVDETTSVLLTKKGLSVTLRVTDKNFEENFGFKPCCIVDLKAIMGDASDNIPGVKGIGEKGAEALIKEFCTLESVYENIGKITGRQKQLLIDQKEIAFLSKKLATIDIQMDIETCFENFRFSLPFNEEARAEFLRLEFFSLAKRMQDEDKKPEIKEATIETHEVEIKDEEELKKFVQKFRQCDSAIVVDGDLIYFDNMKVHVQSDMLGDCLPLAKAVQVLKPVIENKNVKKIVFDYKTLAHFFAQFGAELNGEIEDAQLAQWLVASSIRKGGLPELLTAYGFEKVNAVALREAAGKLKARRDALELDELYRALEVPLLKVLYDMEKTGIKVCQNKLNELAVKYQKELKEIETQIFELAGQEFNVNSPKQVCDLIYDKLQIVKGGGKRSSDISVLAKYKFKHPIVALLISHRELAKLVSTYILPLKEHAREGSLVHTSFNLTGTITGRLSSSAPNLQNIPKRTERGRTIREAFVSRFDGGKLVSADYNQIELRLLAHYSGDEVLIEAYKNGEDIHRRTASEIFGLKGDEISGEARRSAKAVNFGIVYGISPFGLSEQIGVSPAVAKEYIDLYFKRFPKVKTYLDSSVKLAQNSGGRVHTLFGRVRIIDEVFSENFNVREFGRRAAMNFPLQGSAADIIKLAMIKVFNALEESRLRARLVLQVHDELVVDAPADEIERVEKLLKETMESVAVLKLPLVVEVESSYHLT